MRQIFVIFAMTFFVCASAFANDIPLNTHPGANPPGGGWGCDAENPGKSDCQPKPKECKGNSCTQTPPPKDPCPGNSCNAPPPGNSGGNGGGGGQGGGGGTGNGGQGGTGNGGIGNGGTGTGYGGHGTADAAASAWQTMSAAQRAELTAKLTSEQRTEVMTAINSRNENKWTNNSPSLSTSTSAGGKSDSQATGGKSDAEAKAVTGPVNAGGGGATVTTNYRYGVSVQLASIQMPSGVHVAGNLQTTITDCSLRRQDVVMVNEIEARGLGIFKDTSWKNGAVWKLVPTKANVDYSPWEGVGIDDRSNTIEERTAYGQQFKIDSYIVGSAMNNGITIGAGNSSGGSISGGTAGGSNVATYGNNIVALECQKVFRRTVYAPPPTASTSLILVEEKETVRPTGTTWRVGDACKLPGANCKKVEGTSGERTTTVYASECLKPASPEVALRCAQAKGLLGKPPTVTKEALK